MVRRLANQKFRRLLQSIFVVSFLLVSSVLVRPLITQAGCDQSGQCASAIVSGQAFPSVVTPGQAFSVSITMYNNGAVGWWQNKSSTKIYRQAPVLRSLTNIWGVAQVNIPAGVLVAPGQAYTFSFTAYAPSTLGQYSFSWQMYDPLTYGAFGQVAGGTITVQPPPPSIAFGASPSSIDLGSSATLSWAIVRATSASINQSVGGVSPTVGAKVVSPTVPTTYTLTASGPGGTTTQSTTVSINKPVVTLTAAATTLNLGQATSLSWVTKNATNVYIAGVGSGLALSGSTTVTPTQPQTTYLLIATGPGGTTTSQVTLTVQNPALILLANGSHGSVDIAWNAPLNLTWTTTNASTCTASGAWSGNQPVTGSVTRTNLAPGTYSYTLTCSALGKSASDTVQVQVIPAPTLTLRVNGEPGPIAIDYNHDAELAWSSAYTQTCLASGGWLGSKATSGRQSTGNQTTTQTFTLACSGVGGVATANITINVGPAPTGVKVQGDVSSAGNVTGVTVDPSSVVTGGGTISVAGQTLQGYPQSVGGQTWDQIRQSILATMARLERERGVVWSPNASVSLPASATSPQSFNLNPPVSTGTKANPFSADASANPLLPEGGVWVVSGDLDITAPFTFRNTGTIIVKGKITLHGADQITVKNGTLGLVAVGRPNQPGQITIGSDVTGLSGIAFFAENQIQVQ